MKKFSVFTFLFLSFILDVNASPISDDCIDDKTCIVLCNYATVLNWDNRNYVRNLTIYYNFDTQNITLRWQATNTDATVYSKGPGSFSYIFSTSGTNVYWGIDEAPTMENFVCPANGYLDTSDLNSDNELCFDNDGVTCKEEYSNIGTAFAHNGGFVSQEKDYDFEDQITAYKNNIFGDIIEEISNGTFDVENDIADKIYNDFRTNFLYNNEAPAFMTNSPAYLDLVASIEDAYNEAKEQALEEAEKQYEEGSITDEEYQEIVDNWDNDVEQVVQQATTAFENIKLNVFLDIDFNADNGCQSYLGYIDNPDDPAYYLNFTFNLIKYLAIITLFVLTVVEYAKAIPSGKDDAVQRATQNTIKRIIIAVIIFFLPIFINFIFDVLDIVSTDPTCGLGG